MVSVYVLENNIILSTFDLIFNGGAVINQFKHVQKTLTDCIDQAEKEAAKAAKEAAKNKN